MTLPKYMCDELGMPLIDLNTRWIESYETDYLKQARTAAEAAGCFFTNLKVNHGFGDLYSKDSAERMKALAEGRKLIDTAKILGTRWIRFSIPKRPSQIPLPTVNLRPMPNRRVFSCLLKTEAGWRKMQTPLFPSSKLSESTWPPAPTPATGMTMSGIRTAQFLPQRS